MVLANLLILINLIYDFLQDILAHIFGHYSNIYQVEFSICYNFSWVLDVYLCYLVVAISNQHLNLDRVIFGMADPFCHFLDFYKESLFLVFLGILYLLVQCKINLSYKKYRLHLLFPLILESQCPELLIWLKLMYLVDRQLAMTLENFSCSKDTFSYFA